MHNTESDNHLSGQHESAGKHTSDTTRKGNRWLRTTLTEAALAAIRVKDSRLVAPYCRVMRHRRHKKAVVAVEHPILVIIDHLPKDHVPYKELGPRVSSSVIRSKPHAGMSSSWST